MSILSNEAKDILEYAYEQEGKTYPDGEVITARDVLESWYSDEYKDFYGIRPRWESAFPFSNAYLAIDIARVRIAHGDQLKFQEDEAKRLLREEQEHQAKVDEILNPSKEDWGAPIGELVNL